MLRKNRLVAMVAGLACGFAFLLAAPASGAPGGNSMHRYEFRYGPLTWVAAQAAAVAAGGHLATITSETEYQRIRGLAGSDPIWLGGTDVAQEGVWRWVEGGKFYIDDDAAGGAAVRGAVNYWQTHDGWNDEPNNSDGVEHCLEMMANGMWNDLPCDHWNVLLHRAYVIEYD